METSQKDRQRQLKVFDSAQDIYIARGEERGQLWKEFGLSDTVHHIKSKAARIVGMFDHGRVSEDEALDLINYCAFYVRQVRADQSMEEVEI